jgi:hypothetical protein
MAHMCAQENNVIREGKMDREMMGPHMKVRK